MRYFLLAVPISLAAQVCAAERVLEGSNHNRYLETVNASGVKLEAVGHSETLYLGKDCDAYSPNYGNGRWAWGNGGFVVEFPAHRVAFARQELTPYYPKCSM